MALSDMVTVRSIYVAGGLPSQIARQEGTLLFQLSMAVKRVKRLRYVCEWPGLYNMHLDIVLDRERADLNVHMGPPALARIDGEMDNLTNNRLVIVHACAVSHVLRCAATAFFSLINEQEQEQEQESLGVSR
ncbi:hypothetical protein ACLOJK_032203 [Asimina triloba]